jgi:protein SCO1/2
MGVLGMSFLKRHGFKIAVLSLCAAMGVYLLFTYVIKPAEPLPKLGAAPAFEMQDIKGNVVSLESTAGKARLIYFYFANCPDVCPPTTFLLSGVQDKLQEQGSLPGKAEMISITFDPERDTPEVIENFAKRLDVDFDGWHFLRGEEQATTELARAFNIGVKKLEKENTFIHSNLIVLVDQNGEIREWINGNDENLTADYIVSRVNKLF